MSEEQLFKRHSADDQEHYERLARLEYGPDLVNSSIKRWNNYTEQQQNAILEEGNIIYADFAKALEAGESVDSEIVQAIAVRWHNNIYRFYEPTLDILRGLSVTYNTSPEFMANFQQLHADLPDYLHEALTVYVDQLEHDEIVRMLAEDEANQQSRT